MSTTPAAASSRAGGGRRARALLAVLLLAGWTAPALAAPRVTVTNERLIINEMPRGFANVNLTLVNVVTVKNEGDAPLTAVELPLAAGYQGLQFPQGGGDYRVGERSFTDPRPLAPGEERQYVLTYGLGYPRLPNFIERAILHPTQKLTVIVPAGQFALEAPGLMKMGRRAMGETEVEIYENMSPLSPAPRFELKVDKGDRGISPWFWAWVALFAIPALGVAAITLRGRRYRRSGPAGPAGPAGPHGSSPSRTSRGSPSSSRRTSSSVTAPRRSPAS